MLVGPVLPAITTERVVEPPGIAPGSGPLISGTFIAIARANPDGFNIGVPRPNTKSVANAPARLLQAGHPPTLANDNASQ